MGQLKRDAFLEAYAESGNLSHAAKHSGCGLSSHYRWLSEDPEYAAKFEEAQKRAIAYLESEAVRRATLGLRKLKFDKNGDPLIDPETGEPYVEHVYSDTLLIFLLKGACPEKYAERAKVDVRNVTQEDVARFEEQYGLKRLDDAFDNPSQ